MPRIADISPRLQKRMNERSIDDLKALSALTREPFEVNYSSLADCVKGDRQWTLNKALGVLKALGYKFDSEELKILEEMAKTYIPPSERD